MFCQAKFTQAAQHAVAFNSAQLSFFDFNAAGEPGII